MEPTKTERSKAAVVTTREVPFTARAKGASEVIVTGDFTQWSAEGIRLRKGPHDEWRTVLELEPGEYQYRLLVDGAWQDDPQSSKKVPNPYGGHNSVLRVAGRSER